MSTSSYRERVYDVFADTDADVTEQIAHALEVGTEYLDLPIGFLTHIDRDTQRIVRAVGPDDSIRAGETCPLEAAYCRRTIETDGSMAVQDARAAPEVSETAFRTFGLGAYIGAKVEVDGEVDGTICFAAERPRDEPFTEKEELFVELLAKLVGHALERRAYSRDEEERLRTVEREKRHFESIAETSFDIIFRVDLQGEFTYVSSAAERILGYSPDEMEGSPFVEYLPESSIDDALSAYAAVLDGEAIEHVEITFLDVDGNRVAVEVNAVPVRVAGEVQGAEGVGRDVTERKRRERELRLKNCAMDEARVGIAIGDVRRPGNPIVYVNEGFERITGYDAADAVGESWLLLQGEATDPETVHLLRRKMAANEPVVADVINYRADGTPIWTTTRLSPIENDAGEVTHYLGLLSDITDRKRTEQLVALLNRVLRHNLRNDMNAVLLLGSLLQQATTGEPASLGARIENIAARLVGISERARELQRYAQYGSDPRRLDTEAMLTDVVDACCRHFPDVEVDLTVETTRDVCAGAEFQRAVVELVENAVKHNPSPRPWVGIEAVDDGEWVELTVADDGPGIAETEAAVVTRGEETALEHGSGLGLWLVNWIVTRYGGSFRIRAADDGTLATVRVPGVGTDTSVENAARPPTILFR